MDRNTFSARAMTASAGGSIVGNILSLIGFSLLSIGIALTFLRIRGWLMTNNWRRRIVLAGALVVSGALLMIVGYYWLLLIRPFIR